MRRNEAMIAAHEYAREFHTNEEKKAAFISGVEWCIERFLIKLRDDGYANHSGYPHKMIEELDLKDVKRTFFEWTKTIPGELK